MSYTKIKVLKTILVGATLVMVLIMGTLAFYDRFVEGYELDMDLFVFAFSISAFTVSCTFAVSTAKITGVGFGYSPSRELDKAIHAAYIAKCTKHYNELGIAHRQNPYCAPKYSIDTKAAKRLLNFASFKFVSKNVATGAYEFTYDDQTAVAASYEMAICIAFLKANGHNL